MGSALGLGLALGSWCWLVSPPFKRKVIPKRRWAVGRTRDPTVLLCPTGGSTPLSDAP